MTSERIEPLFKYLDRPPLVHLLQSMSTVGGRTKCGVEYTLKDRPLQLFIDPQPGDPFRTVVESELEEEPGRVSTRELSREEIATLPGTQGDPLRALQNFPMQAHGAEMLRLACSLATERGVKIAAPVHDAILIAAPSGEINALHGSGGELERVVELRPERDEYPSCGYKVLDGVGRPGSTA